MKMTIESSGAKWQASGEEQMYFDGNCLIRRAGVTPDRRAQLDLKAEDRSFDWNWFLCPPELTREVLATALAAITCNRRIYCQIQDPAIAWSDVSALCEAIGLLNFGQPAGSAESAVV